MYPEKFILDNVVEPFVPTSVVIVNCHTASTSTASSGAKFNK